MFNLYIKRIRLAIFATALLALPTAAQAALVTYEFTATQTGSNVGDDTGAVTSAASGLSTISGTFTWDTTAGVISSPNAAVVNYATGSLLFNELDVSGFAGEIFTRVENDFSTVSPNNSFDTFSVRTPDFGSRETFRVLFADLSETALTSTALPLALDLASFGSALVTFQTFLDNSVVGQVSFDITSLTATSEVPLPAALPLFVAGLAGIGGVSWRKKRSTQS